MANRFEKYKQPQTLPFKGNPYVDDLGASGASEEEIYNALGAEPPARQNRFSKYTQPQEQFGPERPQQTASQSPKQKESLGRTVFDQSMQGATFGFADDISDRLGVLLATAIKDPKALITGEITDPSLLEEAANARQGTEEKLQRQFQQRPVTSIASNIGGALMTGGIGASTKTGTAISNSLRSGNLAARAAKGSLAGAASGAAYGAGAGVDGEKAASARRGAMVGGAVGVAAPVIGSAVSRSLNKTTVPNSEQIREQGSKLFQIAEQKGGALSAGESNKFYNKILAMRPQTVEGAVFKGESPVSKILDNVETLINKPMTLKAAMEIDEALGDLAYSTMDNFGKISKDGKKFLDMQGTLRRVIEDADERVVHGGKEGFKALKDARKVWSTSLRMREIERIIEKAQGREQPVTALKNGFTNLLNRGDKLKGYSVAEVKAIQKAAKTGIITDVVKLAGSGLVPIGSGITGGFAGGAVNPVTAAMGYAAGSAVQQGAKAVGVARQMGRANQALKTVAEKSGMVTQQPRLTLPEIMKLPPEEAKKLLANMRMLALPGTVALQQK